MAVWLGEFKLDCRSCSSEQQIENGCEEDSPIPGVWNLNGWIFQRCPVKLITEQSWQYVRAYNFLKLFQKWPDGANDGWMRQSEKFLFAIEIIELELAVIQEEKINKAKQKAEHEQPRA